MKQHRTRTVGIALAAALALTVAACGDGDSEDPTTPAPSGPVETDSSQTEDPVDTDDQTAALPGQDDSDQDTASDETTDATDDDATSDDATDAGSGDVPPLDEVWPTAVENARSAESVTATISGTVDGEEMDATLQGQMDDSNFQVKMKMEGASVELIGDGGDVYLNGDEEFWQVAAGMGEEGSRFADTWIIAPPDMGVEESLSFSALWAEFLDGIPTEAEDLQTSTAELSELDGEEVYHYVVQGEDVEIWLSDEGEYIRKVSVVDQGDPLELTATDWDETEEVDPPSDAVSIEELMSQN